MIIYSGILLFQKQIDIYEDIVKFLNKICRVQDKPSEVNQYLIYKLFEIPAIKNFCLNVKTSKEKLERDQDNNEDQNSPRGSEEEDYSLMVNFEHRKEEFEDLEVILLEKNKKKISWIKMLLDLYSNLCKGKNIIWTQELEKKIHPEFLLKAIKDKNYQEVKTECFNLLMHLYIDQDPLTVVNYPKYLKVLSNSKAHFEITRQNELKSFKKKERELKISAKMFRGLLVDIGVLLKKSSQKILRLIDDQYELEINNEAPPLARLVFKCSKQIRSMEGIFNVLELMIKMDVYQFFGQVEELSSLVQTSMKILQYSSHYPLLIKMLDVIYQKKLKKDSNLTGKLALLTGSDLKQDKISNPKAYLDSKNMNVANNPLVQNFFYMKGYISQQMHRYMTKEDAIEKTLKLKIFDILNKIFDKRHDFLLNNVIRWGQEVTTEMFDQHKLYTQYLEEALFERLKAESPTLYPEIMKTSIRSLDRRIKKESRFKSYGRVDFSKDFTKKEIYDFDYLLKNEPSFKSQSSLKQFEEILPSLLAIIVTSMDSEVESKAINFLLRCFSQRNEFVENLKNIYLLTGRDGIRDYSMIYDVNDKLETINKQLDVSLRPNFSIFIFLAILLGYAEWEI